MARLAPQAAIGLARDAERYLQDEPVEACPPSATYRLRKFASKHKAALAVATAFLGLLISGVAVSTAQRNIALQAAASEKHAKEAEIKERERAEANAKLARDNEAVAEQQRYAATQAKESAVQEKNNAVAAREELRNTLYAAEMNLVQVAAESKQYTRAVQLLDQQRPAAGQPDLRGFEWHYWQRNFQRARLRSVEVPQLVSTDNLRAPMRIFSRDGTRLAAIVDYPRDAPLSRGFVGI